MEEILRNHNERINNHNDRLRIITKYLNLQEDQNKVNQQDINKIFTLLESHEQRLIVMRQLIDELAIIIEGLVNDKQSAA